MPPREILEESEKGKRMTLALNPSSPRLGGNPFNLLKTKIFYEALHWGTPSSADVLEDLSAVSSRLVWLSDAPEKAETVWETFHKSKDCSVELHIVADAPELFRVKGHFDQVSAEWNSLSTLSSLEKKVCFFRSASRHLRKGGKLLLIPSLGDKTASLSLGEVLALAKSAGFQLKGASHFSGVENIRLLDLEMTLGDSFTLIFERP
jgi:hypothetical protein